VSKWAVARRVWGDELFNRVVALSACMKVRHATIEDANRHMRDIRTKPYHSHRAAHRTLNAYFCTKCSYWHVGHNSEIPS